MSNTTAPPPPSDPKFSSLQAMFPGVDEGIIREVLQAHGGNDERAVESLLAMTDERFVAEERPGEDVLRSQSQVDEDFARSLALQDEHDAEAHRYARSQQRRQGGGELPEGPIPVNYQPRVRRGAPPQVHPGQQAYTYGRHDTQERGVQQPNTLAGPGIEEQFNKLAVDGKKALSNFMGSNFMKSVQAKINNTQPSTSAAPQDDYTYPINSSSNNKSYSTPDPSEQYNSIPRTQNPDYPASDWATDRSFTPTSDASSINIYHPSPQAVNAPIPPTKDDRLFSSPSGGKRSDEIRRDNTGGRQSPALLGTSPPASNLSSSPSARIDFAKLGLLPKQKISLDGKPTTTVSPSASPVPAAAIPKKVEQPVARKSQDDDEDDDEDALSYTANPFEDEDRR